MHTYEFYIVSIRYECFPTRQMFCCFYSMHLATNIIHVMSPCHMLVSSWPRAGLALASEPSLTNESNQVDGARQSALLSLHRKFPVNDGKFSSNDHLRNSMESDKIPSPFVN